ncbi:MAG: hypothetical protein STSR0009_01770 [Methanoregula sp.]
MRTGLQSLEGKKGTFIATFCRRDSFPTTQGWMRKVLLKHIQDGKHNPVTDHVSVTDRNSLELMGFLKDGDLIAFSARIRKYLRGYKGEDIDLRLKHPLSVDYMLCEVQDVRKLNLDLPEKKNSGESEFRELIKNRRISLGVA